MRLTDEPDPRIGADNDSAHMLAAVAIVGSFVDRLGFDPVPAGRLADSAALQPESSIFGAPLSAEAMRRRLAIGARAA